MSSRPVEDNSLSYRRVVIKLAWMRRGVSRKRTNIVVARYHRSRLAHRNRATKRSGRDVVAGWDAHSSRHRRHDPRHRAVADADCLGHHQAHG